MDTVMTPTLPATKWRPWRHNPRPSMYLDAVTGIGVTNLGEPFRCAPNLSARDLVEMLPKGIETIYLCGELPSAPQVETRDKLLYSPFNSWVIGAQPEWMYLDSGKEHDGTMAIIRRSDGQEVDLRTISAWTGTNDLTPEEVLQALNLVTDRLRSQPNWQDVCLLKTPSLTGLELWRSTIGMSKQSDGQYRSTEYQVLPAELRDLIHRTSGQGRFEMLPCPDNSGMTPDLYYLDDRLAYGARALTELGIGPAIHDFGSKYEGYTPARYKVRFRVPDSWVHVGLLPVQRQLVKGAASIGLEFPRTPEYSGETWVDATELRVAFAPFPSVCPTCLELYGKNDGRSCPQHGWDIQILERIVFTKGRPLHAWAEKLIQVRELCSPNEAARAVVRNILLHTIGAFHGSRRPVTHVAGDTSKVPEKIPLQIALNPDGEEQYLWTEEGVTPRNQDYNRPEWSSQIWARERARLLLNKYGDGTFTGALTQPYDSIVAFRLDAMYTTIDPHWPDNGRPGQMRFKGYLPGPVPWPREETDLALVKEMLEREKR